MAQSESLARLEGHGDDTEARKRRPETRDLEGTGDLTGDGIGAMGGQEGRKAHMEQSPPLWRAALPRPGQARNKSRLQVPGGVVQLGEKAPWLVSLCLFRLPFSFGGEGEVAPHCGHSHILQSRGGGSKKQNKQKHSGGPWPRLRHRLHHQEGLSSNPTAAAQPSSVG